MSRERQIGKCLFSDEQCRSVDKPEYITRKTPVRDAQQRLVVAHAPEISYECASCLWQEMNERMDAEIDRTDAQVVILTPHEDVTRKLYDSLQKSPLGKYTVATTEEKRWQDNSSYVTLKDEAPQAQSVYVVTSMLDEADLLRAIRVASHYKHELNAKYATLIAPYMVGTREDKNVDPKDPNKNYRPNTINLYADLKAISSTFDRMICYEAHSSATQTYAAEMGMPLMSLSVWPVLIDHLKKNGVIIDGKRVYLTPENSVVEGPDKGRNLAAKRIAEDLETLYVSFDKTRHSENNVTVYELAEEDRAKVEDRIATSYDDEVDSMGTMETVANKSHEYGSKKHIAALAHIKFTGEWEDKAQNPVFAAILGTDSRQPIGDISKVDKVKIITLGPLIREVIGADMKGVNFWEDKEFQKMILQPHNNEIEH